MPGNTTIELCCKRSRELHDEKHFSTQKKIKRHSSKKKEKNLFSAAPAQFECMARNVIVMCNSQSIDDVCCPEWIERCSQTGSYAPYDMNMVNCGDRGFFFVCVFF